MPIDVEPALGTHNSPAPVVLTGTPGEHPIDLAVAAARRVIDALLRADRDRTADLTDITGDLDAVADRLSKHAPPLDERLHDMWNGPRRARHDPITGAENPLAMPLTIHGLADGSVAASVTLSVPYQGPPGNVHGGVIASLLDHVSGLATVWEGTPSRTAQLNIRYHRPTLLFDALTVAARCTEINGRKLSVVGEVKNSQGEVCASAEGLFIAPRWPVDGRQDARPGATGGGALPYPGRGK